MREIKFRMWYTDGKRMFWEPRTGVAHHCSLSINDEIKELIDNGNPFMQFIGLQDKKGKDIYQDDILKIGEKSFVNMVVKWDSNSLRWSKMYLDIDSYYQPFIEEESKYIEVVGNLYENPELLNDKSK